MDRTTESGADIEAVLVAYLVTQFPILETCNAHTPLLEGGVVDSIGVLELMTFVSERFGIGMEDSDFVPENVETPSHIVQFIQRKRRQ
jgi:acyl carrier protein